MLGISIDDDELIVVISDLEDVVVFDDVCVVIGMTICFVVVARSELRKLIDCFKCDDSDFVDIVMDLYVEDLLVVSNFSVLGDDVLFVCYMNSLIEQAIQSRASDLHFEFTENDMRVRFRIDGVLHEVDKVFRAVQAAFVSRLKIMSNVDIIERRVLQSGRITVSLNNHIIDLCTAILLMVWGEKVVLCVLDTGGVDLDLTWLGFIDANYARYATSFCKLHGMVLVTGPTGSGKSTTLYATLTEINKPEINIIIVEDLVEYCLFDIN